MSTVIIWADQIMAPKQNCYCSDVNSLVPFSGFSIQSSIELISIQRLYLHHILSGVVILVLFSDSRMKLLLVPAS